MAIAISFLLFCSFAVLAIATVDYERRNFKTIQKIYNTTIHPNNQEFLRVGSSAVASGLFNQKAAGRITPIGNFSGFEDSVEYFFGLTPPAQFPLFDTWTKAEIVSFSSGCPEVATSIVHGETTGINPNASTFGKKVTTIKQVAFWRFDDHGAVLYYDAYIPSLGAYTALLYGTTSTPQFQAATIQQICSNTQQLCTGSNQQFKSKDACVNALTAKKFGTFDEAWGDNVVCRSLHILLAKLRPDAHCPHVGPTGGGKCVDVNYNDVYFDDQALFGAPVGETFVCPRTKKHRKPTPVVPDN